MLVHQDINFQHYHHKGSLENLDQAANRSFQSPIEQPMDLRNKKTFTTFIIDTERSNLVELVVNPMENCINSTIAVQAGLELKPIQR